MLNLFGVLLEFIAIFLIVAIAIYIAVAIFLNKFNKLVYGKGTAMAWLPVFNIYLLGKLTFNKLIGWVLVICSFLTGSASVTIGDVKIKSNILPEEINSIVSKIYYLAIIGLLIYAIVKYNKIKKSHTNSNSEYQQPTQEIEQQTVQVPTQEIEQQAVQVPTQQIEQQTVQVPTQEIEQQSFQESTQQPTNSQNFNNNGQI